MITNEEKHIRFQECNKNTVFYVPIKSTLDVRSVYGKLKIRNELLLHYRKFFNEKSRGITSFLYYSTPELGVIFRKFFFSTTPIKNFTGSTKIKRISRKVTTTS